MDRIFRRSFLAFKALRQMGLRPLALYGLYRFGIRSGHYKRMEERSRRSSSVLGGATSSGSSLRCFPYPSSPDLASMLGERASEVVAEANEVVDGKARLFGWLSVPLQFSSDGRQDHWTVYEEGKRQIRVPEPQAPIPPEGRQDVKFVWEPGRFGWVFPLARAYCLTGDEKYPRAFWKHLDAFGAASPAGFGPLWASAQEVALRSIALAFAWGVFASSESASPERASILSRVAAEHAARIPMTLPYARSQNNNHLLSEAAGLYTAGVFLANHPSSPGWKELGWRWLQRGFQSQIAADGSYAQNSANYHRLMLQLALWVEFVAKIDGRPFPEPTLRKLAAATRWLLALVDPQSGRAPNLGPNDGAHILPLSACSFDDYRPVLQAASQAFLVELPFSHGPWDELRLWLGEQGSMGARVQGRMGADVLAIPTRSFSPAPQLPGSPVPPPHQPTSFHSPMLPPQALLGRSLAPLLLASPHILASPSGESWAYFRVARHLARPGHADQLHLDLWWKGLNVAIDPGTYLYNGLVPWENALSGAFVHNTVTLNGRDQMTRAGRFLWLDWAQGRVVLGERCGAGGPRMAWARLAAEHDGYRKLGAIHRREVAAQPGESWIIIDDLIPARGKRPAAISSARLHWLAPDWPWEIERDDDHVAIHLSSPLGPIILSVRRPSESVHGSPLAVQLVRAGELLYGEEPASPTWGWFSPSYGLKAPALSFSVTVAGRLPLRLESHWVFPQG